MNAEQERPWAVLLVSFSLSLVFVTLFQRLLPAAEVYFSGTAWPAFACGSFLGLGLGLSKRGAVARPATACMWAVLTFLSIFVVIEAYAWLAGAGLSRGPVLFAALAAPPLPFFLFLARLVSPLGFGGTRATVHVVLGGLSGAFAAKAVCDGYLGGRAGIEIVAGILVAACLIASWLRGRRARRPDAEGTETARTPVPGASMPGAALLGFALAAAYPVTRKVLLQLAPAVPGTDLMIFGSALSGALLGALLLLVFFSRRWRLGAAVLGTIALALGLYLLGKGFAFTQDMRGFADFKSYISRQHESFVPFVRGEVPLYLALLGAPALAAGAALVSLRGAWRSFLFGMASGFPAGCGLLPWKSDSAALVLQAGLAAAAAATVLVLTAVTQGDRFLSKGWRLVSSAAAAGMWGVVIFGVARFESSDYKDLPIPGEQNILLFEPSIEGDLRVTTSAADEALVRLDSSYAYRNRGFGRVGELVGTMPGLLGMKGRCLVAGPLAPVMAPLIGGTATGQGAPGGGVFVGLLVEAREAIPALEDASWTVANHEGFDVLSSVGSMDEPLAVFLSEAASRYDHVVFLPRFPGSDASRGFLSREIFRLVHETLQDEGRFWLFLDTAGLTPRAAGSVASAFADVFENSSLWLVEDGLLPPFLLCLGIKGKGKLDAAAVTKAVEKRAREMGLASAGFEQFSDLGEYLLAGPEGMGTLRNAFRPVSAFFPLDPGRLAGETPGWTTVAGLLDVLPPSSLQSVCDGGVVHGEERKREARGRVVQGLLVHRSYTFQIDEEHDVDWDLFEEETKLYGEAFRAHPGTNLGRRILAALMPMLINTNQLQTVYETITSVAGEAPDDPRLRYDLGYVSFKLLDFEDALAHFQAAAKRDPLFADAVLYTGLTLFALKRMEEAAEILEKAEELDPEKNVLYKPLAIALHQTGRLEDARRACGRALEISPEDADLQSLRILIEDGINDPSSGDGDERE